MQLNFIDYFFSDKNTVILCMIAVSLISATLAAIFAGIYFRQLIFKIKIKLEKSMNRLEMAETEKSKLEADVETLKIARTPELKKFNHDLRQTINNILGIANLLNESEVTAKQNEYVKIIIDSGQICLKLSNDLLGIFNENQSELPISNINDELQLKNKKLEISANFAKLIPLSILVAEDDAINKMIATKMLEKLGYEIDIADNGKEALEIVSHKYYDIIFMDIYMPVMNGLEATKMIRLCLEEQPVIFAVTASVFDEEKRNCIEAGMNDIITKPMRVDDVASMIEKWFVKKRDLKKIPV